MTDELTIVAYFSASERYDEAAVSAIPDDIREDINATLQTIESAEE